MCTYADETAWEGVTDWHDACVEALAVVLRASKIFLHTGVKRV